MKFIEDTQENNRAYIRASVIIRMCLIVKDETSLLNGFCSPVVTLNMSLGGVCVKSRLLFSPGETLIFYVKNNLPLKACASCEKSLNISSIPFEPIETKVVWVNEYISGLQFISLTPSNKIQIQKIVWKQHREEIRRYRNIKRGYE